MIKCAHTMFHASQPEAVRALIGATGSREFGLSEENMAEESEAQKSGPDRFIGLGIALGAGIGVAIGAAMDNMGAGIGIGIGIGLALGTGLALREHRKNPEK